MIGGGKLGHFGFLRQFGLGNPDAAGTQGRQGPTGPGADTRLAEGRRNGGRLRPDGFQLRLFQVP